MSSLFSISERIVSQKGSGAHVIAGLLILIVGAAFGLSTESDAIVYAAIVIGLVIIISAFLMIIKQYERAIILRLGRYHRQAGPGVQTRIPFVDSVLVVDVREKVREFKAERMLTKDNVPVTIDAILRYRIIEERARDAVLNVENFNQMIQQVSQTTLRNNIGSSVFQDIVEKGGGKPAHQGGDRKRGEQLGNRSHRSRDPAGDNPARTRSCYVDAGAGGEGKERTRHLRRIRSAGRKAVPRGVKGVRKQPRGVRT
jgi:hypothetical protein